MHHRAALGEKTFPETLGERLVALGLGHQRGEQARNLASRAEHAAPHEHPQVVVEVSSHFLNQPAWAVHLERRSSGARLTFGV
jgi:hypothetical protein